jgi:hypothetical protein
MPAVLVKLRLGVDNPDDIVDMPTPPLGRIIDRDPPKLLELLGTQSGLKQDIHSLRREGGHLRVGELLLTAMKVSSGLFEETNWPLKTL